MLVKRTKGEREREKKRMEKQGEMFEDDGTRRFKRLVPFKSRTISIESLYFLFFF